nr:cGMP-dependent protein kinase 1-like [Cherax quadricarinatus]
MSLLLNGVNQCISSMGSLELQEILGKKDDLIRDLEQKLKFRENEITELRSQLDKFQSVIPYATVGASSTTKDRARKTRAQGISAEPQTLKTVQELAVLSQTTFPEVPKSLRYGTTVVVPRRCMRTWKSVATTLAH